MSNFLDLCNRRYSVRAYESRVPDVESWNYVMECVRRAPSAVNFQPWRFKYVTSTDELSLLYQCYPREWFKSVPACFVAYKNNDEAWIRKSDGKSHADIDVAIAVEHLCLAAAELGIGTCWVCNFDVEKCKELFPVGDELEPVVLIPFGYPADQVKEKNRKTLSALMI